MKKYLLAFVVAVGLYAPTARYGFVQDDRAIVLSNPAAHSVPAAIRAFDDPYWPRASGAGLYRPVTILSFAWDWTASGGRTGWLHFMNALWHGVVTVLVMLVLARWLPEIGVVAAGLVFALHPVHVEGVASLVSRAELLAAAALLGAVLAARRSWWAAAIALAALSMLSKEHGVVTGVVILLDDWLHPVEGGRRYPRWFYGALAGVTLAYAALWLSIGRPALADVAAPFLGTGLGGRLALALPALWHALGLLVFPISLSADYGPQVIPYRTGPSLAALGGALVVLLVPALAWWSRRRRVRAVAFAAGASALAYLPASNLLFASGILLAERTLYLPVLLVATVVGYALSQGKGAWPPLVLVALALALGARSYARVPVWKDNRSSLLALLEEHPESYQAHASAAAVYAGLGDTLGARREYERATRLFDRDPHLLVARAQFLLGIGDTATAAPVIARARELQPNHVGALRAQYALYLSRGDTLAAAALRDSLEAYPVLRQ